MTSSHPKTNVAGILCLHNIRVNHLKGNSNLPTKLLKDLCGDTADVAQQVVLVSTHWDRVKSNAMGRERERALRQTVWASLSAAGAKMERFNNTEEAARGIIGGLLHSA